MRKMPLIKGFIYHIFTKSIEGYRVFRSKKDYLRFIEAMKFYQISDPKSKLSVYLRSKDKDRFFKIYLRDKNKRVDILAYCLMPTHLHFLLVPKEDGGISEFMRCVLDSYTRYFNAKTNRKGPLWQGRFKSVLIEDEEQFIHTTRYIHLNPTTGKLVDSPQDWKFSSYLEYINRAENKICNFKDYYSIDPEIYRRFVESQIEYQRALRTTS